MTTARKIESNRNNARASTGPNTAQGKARTARNACRHALSVSIFNDPERSTEIDNLAFKITGKGAEPDIVELARNIARAQIDLARVHQAQQDLLSREINNPEFRPKKFAYVLSDLSAQLIVLDRYERRALSKRKFAIRAFDLAACKSSEPTLPSI